MWEWKEIQEMLWAVSLASFGERVVTCHPGRRAASLTNERRIRKSYAKAGAIHGIEGAGAS